ncbi:MAG: hypothetical protein IJU95_09925, partial [Treponema sp.]|nr:hypothetical protein [Treponema sp.]
DIEEYVQDRNLRNKMNCVTKTEKGHGRTETRTAFTTNEVSWMPGGRESDGRQRRANHPSPRRTADSGGFQHSD